MNVADIFFMNETGKIKPDSDIFDILWWMNFGSGRNQIPYPSDALYPDDALYPALSESN